MGTLELITSSETSKDLEHHEHQCHVDILGAIGMAKFPDGYIAVFRVKYLDDRKSISAAREQFIQWTMREQSKMKGKVGRHFMLLADEAMNAWLHDACRVCNGLKYQLVPCSPMLSDKPCVECNGTGLRRLRGDRYKVELMQNIMQRADNAVTRIRRCVARKIG